VFGLVVVGSSGSGRRVVDGLLLWLRRQESDIARTSQRCSETEAAVGDKVWLNAQFLC